MKSPFVPLSANNLQKVQKTFVPKVLPPANLSATPTTISAGNHPPSSGHAAGHGEPTIELKREGERVVGITVRCRCGEIIEIECVS